MLLRRGLERKKESRHAERSHVDGQLEDGKLFFDMTDAPGEDAIDGIKVDQEGNLYISGAGGLWVIWAQGKHLGTIIAPNTSTTWLEATTTAKRCTSVRAADFTEYG